MTNAKHTPAPWMVEPINDGYTYQITSSEPKDFIVIAETPDGLEIDEANARLIAAAPELLEALKERVIAEEKEAHETGEIIRLGLIKPVQPLPKRRASNMAGAGRSVRTIAAEPGISTRTVMKYK